MTGPEGDQSKGYWEILEAEPPRRLVFNDGFANADGYSPNTDMPLNSRPSDPSRTSAAGRSSDVDPEHFPQCLGAMEQVLARWVWRKA